MNYNGISGQSLADVCLNTYGSLDYFYKLLQDSGVENGDALVATGQSFTWDETLVIDAQVLRTTTLGNIRYATAFSGNGSTYYVVIGGNQPIPPTGGGSGGGGYIPPTPTNMYQKTSATTYTALADDESVITLVPLQGKSILQIERNIQPLLPSDYSWDTTSGVLTLGNPMLAGETLFILYTEMVTS
jgi:hypothetical protein